MQRVELEQWLWKMGPVNVPDYRGPTLAERFALAARAQLQERDERAAQALAELEQAKQEAAGAMVTGRTSDAEIRAIAERRAWLVGGRIDALEVAMTSADLLVWIGAQVEALQARPFVFRGEVPESDQLRGFLARARCPMWWRRQLRRAAVRHREAEGRAAGEVCAARRQPYVTNDTAHRYRQRKASNAAMMEATQLENDGGQVVSLADLAAVSVSSKAIRRGELMTRIAGCERWAQAMGQRGVFLTLTAPSRFHSMLRHGGRNPKWDGSEPKDAQAWLCKAWQRARAKLQRAGVSIFGFRVAEPHHDGCPHWHALLWAKPGQLWRAVRIIKRAWLKLEGDEAGARAHRCKAVLMRQGGAAGYIAKYVAKNIDDAGRVGSEGHHDGETEADSKGADPEGMENADPAWSRGATPDLFGGTAGRVEAWASCCGIRQFQAIGQPPVTVWRELRRIQEKGGATPRMQRALDAVNRDGATRADWAAYVLEQGGMCKGRNYLLRVAVLERFKVGRYESVNKPCPIGVSDATVPGSFLLSGRREWRPRGQWERGRWETVGASPAAFLITAEGIKPNPRHGQPQRRVYVPGEQERRGVWAPRVSPWTRVNNCTRAGRLEAWPDTIKRQNSGEFATMRTPHEPEPPDRSALRERIARIQALRRL